MPVPDHPVHRPARRLLRDLTYDRLLEAILDGDFVPGERLYDDELARWLQVSKTPVKEAVARLADQGLVEIRANKYTRVTEVSPDDLVDVLELLGALLAATLRGLPADSTEAAAVADRVVERTRRGSCLDIVLEAQVFSQLSTNHLVAGSAEPLVHRIRFLFRHLCVDLGDHRVAPALREARNALAGRRWADAAEAFGVVFSRSTLCDVVVPRPYEAVASTPSSSPLVAADAPDASRAPSASARAEA